MFKEIIYRPRQAEHQRLADVASGKSDISSSPEKIGAELLREIDLKELVFDLYEINRNDTGKWGKYISVEEPELIEDTWYIRKFLSTTGQLALDSMNVGWLWNHEILDVAVPETIDYYQDFLRKGTIPIKEAEQLVGNTDERLREVRNQLVYFKMSATKHAMVLKGNRIV
jgi:hypothetical protein